MQKINIKTISERDFFETSDISLVTTVNYFGGQIESIDKSNPSRAIFFIRKDTGLDNIIQGFWNHTLQVEPLAFFNSLKEVKTRLYHHVE